MMTQPVLPGDPCEMYIEPGDPSKHFAIGSSVNLMSVATEESGDSVVSPASNLPVVATVCASTYMHPSTATETIVCVRNVRISAIPCI